MFKNRIVFTLLIALSFCVGVAIEQTKLINHLWTAWLWFPPTTKLCVIALVVMCAVMVMAYSLLKNK